jgi:hypothetical protein
MEPSLTGFGQVPGAAMKNTKHQEKMVVRDDATGLSLVRDERDPPRFYLRFGKRHDLVSIGDASAAWATYADRARRLRALQLRARQRLAPDRIAEVTGLIQQVPAVTDANLARVH